MFLPLMIFFIMTTIFLYLTIMDKTFKRSKSLLYANGSSKEKFLIVIAHPDDEVMFFAPTILTLLRLTRQDFVYVLCLSNGNAYGCGKLREAELEDSCSALGLVTQNVHIVNHPLLEDGKKWSHKAILKFVAQFVTEHNIDKVISFDAEGVSKHLNHCAIGVALRNLLKNNSRHLVLAQLISVNLFRKYSSFADLWFTLYEFYCTWPAMALFVSSPADVLISNSTSEVVADDADDDMEQRVAGCVTYKDTAATVGTLLPFVSEPDFATTENTRSLFFLKKEVEHIQGTIQKQKTILEDR